jgi:hypothetical protein
MLTTDYLNGFHGLHRFPGQAICFRAVSFALQTPAKGQFQDSGIYRRDNAL